MVDATFVFFLIFFGAAFFATIALYTRQTIILAYIFVGVLIGPYGLKLIGDTDTILSISEIGIMFLLFLLGLDLQLKSLMEMLGKSVLVTFGSSLILGVACTLACYQYGLEIMPSIIIGTSMVFSSTIICLKLLPITTLHHQRQGNIVISILLLQDIMAIIMLTVLDLLSTSQGSVQLYPILKILAALPILVVVGYFAQKYIIMHLLRKFNRVREYIFLLAIAWCLGMAELAVWFGLSSEIGAFIAGVSLAASPISQYIAESLKPLRNFFLIIFFFSVGANFNYQLVPSVLYIVCVLVGIVLVVKPIAYALLLKVFKEKTHVSWSIGLRVGQASEFSLLLGLLALQSHIISQKQFIIIQAVVIITFVISSYIVVLRLPNPIAISDKLRRD
jgi:Kef-type K+ transport system membrane component KefB